MFPVKHNVFAGRERGQLFEQTLPVVPRRIVQDDVEQPLQQTSPTAGPPREPRDSFPLATSAAMASSPATARSRTDSGGRSSKTAFTRASNASFAGPRLRKPLPTMSAAPQCELTVQQIRPHAPDEAPRRPGLDGRIRRVHMIANQPASRRTRPPQETATARGASAPSPRPRSRDRRNAAPARRRSCARLCQRRATTPPAAASHPPAGPHRASPAYDGNVVPMVLDSARRRYPPATSGTTNAQQAAFAHHLEPDGRTSGGLQQLDQLVAYALRSTPSRPAVPPRASPPSSAP